MKPAAFDYLAPRSIDEALHHLAEFGPRARVLAGGQSLVRLMNARSVSPDYLVDINRIPGLDRVEADNGTVRIGALARQRGCEQSPVVRERIPVLAEAGHEVSHVSVRQRGTVVGSVAFADPAAELPAALLVLDGEVLARSATGQRTITAAEFFTGPWRNALRDDEIVTELRIPSLAQESTGSAFVEVTRRHGELPVCGAASVVVLDDADRITSARIALCGVDDRPVRAAAAERALTGQQATPEGLADAARLAARDINPIADAHGSADYRRHVAAVVARRSLQRAVDRARKGADHG